MTISTLTNRFQKLPRPTTRHWWIFGSVAGVVLVLLGMGIFVYWSQQSTIAPHASIAGIDVGGLTVSDATKAATRKWTTFTTHGFSFTTPDGQSVVLPIMASADSDSALSVDLVSFDPAASVQAAYSFSHTGPWWQRLRYRVSGWIGHVHTFGRVAVDTTSLTDTLRQKVGSKDRAATNANFSISPSGTVTILASTNGSGINYPEAVSAAWKNARLLQSNTIPLTTTTVTPDIASSESLKTIVSAEAPAVLALAPLTLTAGTTTKTVDKKTLTSLLGFVRVGNDIHIGFDRAATTTYLQKLADTVNVQAQNARFAISNGQVQTFSTAVTGETVNIEKSLAALDDAVIQKKTSQVALAVDTTQPVSTTLPANDFGITDLVGEGVTDFHGSPTNRRFNLTLGSDRLNGLLIAPGETFSLVHALGAIDAAHGWKPELVIKGSDIKPEFGGGLCQVATTLFRAILNAGLPVTERHNHSLRIRYYEPPVGLDATIYDPQPDLRFTNDYGHYLLLQTSVSGTKLDFRFYGTTDGRTVDLPTPKVFNIKPIPPTQNVETTDLKPGQKNCQAPGHPGADAIATYTVTYADGHINKQTFTSHYRAMPVICQVGVKKAAPKVTPPAPIIDTNTVPPTDTNTSTNTNQTTSNTNAT